MARSTCIYVILTKQSEIVACFTVKHEAMTYWNIELDQDPSYVMLRYVDSPQIYGDDPRPEPSEVAFVVN